MKRTAGVLGSLLGHYRIDTGKNPKNSNKSDLRSVLRQATKIQLNRFKLEIRKFFQSGREAELWAKPFDNIFDH